MEAWGHSVGKRDFFCEREFPRGRGRGMTDILRIPAIALQSPKGRNPPKWSVNLHR
jgi:hypothetical protein